MLAEAGAKLIVSAMADLEAGRLVAVPQDAGGVLYAAKIDKTEARIDFSRSAGEVHNHIRGLSPFPGAWFEAAGQQEGSSASRCCGPSPPPVRALLAPCSTITLPSPEGRGPCASSTCSGPASGNASERVSARLSFDGGHER